MSSDHQEDLENAHSSSRPLPPAAVLVASVPLLYLVSPFVLLGPIEWLGWSPYGTPLEPMIRAFYLPLRWYLEARLPGSALYIRALDLAGIH